MVRDATVENLQEFIKRFRHLNVRSNAQSEDLVGQRQQIIRGVKPQHLRETESLRERAVGELTSIGTLLDGLLSRSADGP